MRIEDHKFYYYDNEGKEQWVEPSGGIHRFTVIDSDNVVLHTGTGFIWFGNYKNTGGSTLRDIC